MLYRLRGHTHCWVPTHFACHSWFITICHSCVVSFSASHVWITMTSKHVCRFMRGEMHIPICFFEFIRSNRCPWPGCRATKMGYRETYHVGHRKLFVRSLRYHFPDLSHHIAISVPQPRSLKFFGLLTHFFQRTPPRVSDPTLTPSSGNKASNMARGVLAATHHCCHL